MSDHDAANAALLASRLAGRYRYVPAWRRWVRLEHGRWVVVHHGVIELEAMAVAAQLAAIARREPGTVRRARAAGMLSGIRAMRRAAARTPGVAASPDELGLSATHMIGRGGRP